MQPETLFSARSRPVPACAAARSERKGYCLERKKKPVWPWVVGAAGMLLVAAAYLVLSMVLSPASSARRALELGERFLNEGDYRQAVLQFQDAIEIAQRRVDQPEVAAIADQAQPLLEQAAQAGAVRQVQQNGGNVQAAVIWLDALACDQLPGVQVFYDAQTLLEELRDLCAAEDYDAVFVRLADESYKQTVAELMGLNCEVKLFDPEDMATGETADGQAPGLMTAIYRMEVATENFTDGTEENYMVYYGQHQAGVRQGEGVWLAYQAGNNYLARGTWDQDRPNGSFESRSWQTELNETVTYRVIIGTVADGLWDGRVTWRFERGDETDEYTPSFDAGRWQILREENGLAIAADNGGGNVLVATDPEALNGIAGYAEAA